MTLAGRAENFAELPKAEPRKAGDKIATAFKHSVVLDVARTAVKPDEAGTK